MLNIANNNQMRKSSIDAPIRHIGFIDVNMYGLSFGFALRIRYQ